MWLSDIRATTAIQDASPQMFKNFTTCPHDPSFALFMSPYRAFLFVGSPFCRRSLGFGASQVLIPKSPCSTAFYATIQFPSTASLPPLADPPRHEIKKDMSTITEVVGHSGVQYVIQRVLQEKGPPMSRVYLATYVLLKLTLPLQSTFLTSGNPALGSKRLY